MGYLFLCSPARLLRHIPRQAKRIITMPIMATPSFMPNQTESKESTVSPPFPTGENNGCTPLRGDAESRPT
jgi:hypothetical protein